jgi:hypothetical protein
VADVVGMPVPRMPTVAQLDSVRQQQLALATLHAQMEPILALSLCVVVVVVVDEGGLAATDAVTRCSPEKDSEEATPALFERSAAQFQAREAALSELMTGVRTHPHRQRRHPHPGALTGEWRRRWGPTSALQLAQLAKDAYVRPVARRSLCRRRCRTDVQGAVRGVGPLGAVSLPRASRPPAPAASRDPCTCPLVPYTCI